MKNSLLGGRFTIDSNGCWNWTGCVKANGYGWVGFRGKSIGAHRAAYMEAVGEIPEGHDVCHKCDNRTCIRPDHLFTGTRKENIQDCVRKGRFPKPMLGRTGERSNPAKLTWREVREIRKRIGSGEKLRVIAASYEVTDGAISHIKNGRTWPVSDDPELFSADDGQGDLLGEVA